MFLLASCSAITEFFEKPGEGAKAEKGYRICDPVIQALEKYQQQKKAAYPAKLESLVPDYLPSVPAGSQRCTRSNIPPTA